MADLSLSEIASMLLEQQSAIVTAHISPDPDAIGASFGLALALQRLGQEIFVYLADPVPERLKSFVSGISFGRDVPERKFDAWVVVDTAARKRVGENGDLVQACVRKTLNIDHHLSNDRWGDFNYIDSDAPASAVIVWELLPQLKVALDRQLANLLYAGLLDDTGGFCFSNTNPRAFRCAAALVEGGAQPAQVANELYFTQPMRVLKLHALGLEALKIMLNGRVAYMTITKEGMDRCGARQEDAEGLVDLARRVGGTEVAVLQREIDDGWKFSIRAKTDSIDVNSVAGTFGGGGHRAAAGCKLIGTCAEVELKMLLRLKEVLR